MSSTWELFACGGYLGSDPVLKYPGGNSVVVNFQIALNYKIKGEKNTEWRRCRAWGKTAELIAEHFKKGDQIVVGSRRLERDSWIDKNNQPQNETYIVVEWFQFAGGKKGNTGT